MPRTSKHGRYRILERNEEVNNLRQAKKMAYCAWTSGKPLGDFSAYPDFLDYLAQKKKTRTCKIRVYRGNIYIWAGENKTLVTSYPVPDHFKAELGDKII